MTANKLSTARDCHALFALQLLVVAPLFCWSPNAPARQGKPADPPTVLVTGQVVEQEFQADQSRSFSYSAEASHSYLVTVNQGGLDLVVSVTAPGGATQSYDSPLFRDETELVVVDATESGAIEVVLASHEYTGAAARIWIELTELPTKSPLERKRLSALRQMSNAAHANHQGKLDGWNRALTDYDRANQFWLETGDKRQQARSLYSIATIEYWQMLSWDRAADLAARAAALYQASGESRLAANAIALQAAAIIEKANEVEKSDTAGLAPEAGALFNQALELFAVAGDSHRQLGAHFDAAKTTNNIGLTHYYMGDWDAAAGYFQQAAEMFRSADEWHDEIIPLSNLAVIDFERGNLVKAIGWFQRTLTILPPEDQRARADLLDNLGAAQQALGQLDDALQSFSKAELIHQQIDDLKGQGRSLAGIGTTYYGIGELELALEYLDMALQTREKANDGRGQVSVLNFIGNIEREIGNHANAMKAHSQAQLLVTAPIDKTRGQLLLARDLIAAGQPEVALEVLSQAGGIATDLKHQKLLADSLRVSADAWLQLDQPEQALDAYLDAENKYQTLGLGTEQAQAKFGIAQSFRELGELQQAVGYAEQAITAVERLRSQLIDPEFRAFFLAARQEYYAFLIDLLMALHQQSGDDSDEYLRRALSVNERSRARALIDLMGEASTLRTVSEPSSSNVRQSKLLQQLAEDRYRLNRLVEKEAVAELQTAERIVVIKRDMAAIENELNLLQIEKRQRDPQYANLTNPPILDAGQIQELLDDDTALLQYSLGKARSFVWLVTTDSIQAWALQGRDDLEQVAREAYDLLKKPAISATDSVKLDEALAELSTGLLTPIGPLPQQRILVVADGVLQYLPFSVLRSSDSNDDHELLIANHEIIYLPSVSVLATQRKSYHDRKAPTRDIAIFADPVFSYEDSRLAGTVVAVDTSSTRPKRVTPATTTALQLQRLPATAEEAKSIAALVNPDQLLLELGFDASRASVFASNLERFRFIHFATHGLIDSRYPALSSLALSQFDANGNPHDGFLRLADISSLRLNADLVALSACSTALGREISGEGLTGLTQGLMYSGSRSVLASLWQVSDRATAELMKQFYHNVLNNHQKPANALRNAQLALSSQVRWKSPYYWSAFVLQGEWL